MIINSLKTAILLSLLSLPFIGKTQAPQFFKYQSIARNSTGLIIPNANVGLRITIHDLNATGIIVYQETHAISTNEFGLFSLSIGGGTPLVGTLSAVDWANGAKYLEIEGDLSGGTSYLPFGTSELLSVPYAIYANTAGIPVLPNGTSIGNTPYWDGVEWLVNNNNIYNAGSKVGIGTNSPVQKLHVNGHINIPLDSAYMINNRKILWAKGIGNIFIGNNAGESNSIGFNNSFLGYNAGNLNSVGSQNTFLGTETGSANIDGSMNSFVGRRAGFNNTNGNENTFMGAYAGQSNSGGMHNSFFGVTAGSSNTLGEENTFIGAHAGYFNNLGSFNAFVGNFSGLTNTAGNNNTFVGYSADAASSNLSNASAFGAGAIVNADNSVVIGNTSVTSIGGQVGWSTFSDRRLKTNIVESTLGLEFIKALKPVNYEYKAKGQENIIYSGLIAQDVEKILTSMKLEFSGLVKPKNEFDYYSIRYAEFVIPLINATQEQQEQIEELKKENIELAKKLDELEKKLNKILKNQD